MTDHEIILFAVAILAVPVMLVGALVVFVLWGEIVRWPGAVRNILVLAATAVWVRWMVRK